MRLVHPSTAIFSFVTGWGGRFNSATGRTGLRGAEEQTMTHHIRTIDLSGEQLSVFVGRPGERVRVLFGAIWLTQEGESGDVILGAGTELPLQGGRIVLEALEPARLQVLGQTCWPQPLQRLARGLRYCATRLQLGPVQPEPVT
jgi:Protein of unknown function (DUF2917)